MATAYDILAETLSATDFTVTYEITSTVTIGASLDDLEMFMAESADHDEMEPEELRSAFLAWCIREDGYDYEARSHPVIREVIENNEA